MSQRLGMSDGRCFTLYTNQNLLNDAIMHGNGISLEDNYTYRMFLQQAGHEVMDSIMGVQLHEHQTPNSVSCTPCNTPLLKVSTPY